MKMEISIPVWNAIILLNRMLEEIHKEIIAPELPALFIPQRIEMDLENPSIFNFWSDGVSVEIRTFLRQGRYRVDLISFGLKARSGQGVNFSVNPTLILSPNNPQEKSMALEGIKRTVEL